MKIQYGLQMTQNLTDFLTRADNKKYATQHGTKIHAKLQSIVIDEIYGNRGDSEIINDILQKPNLKQYFCAATRTEVPIAGFVNGIFISRRIDRLLVDHDTKTIDFIDYKSDTDKNMFVKEYKKQLNEYAHLLQSAYPDYKIRGYILWLADWTVQQMFPL